MHRYSLVFCLILFFLASACAQNKQDRQLLKKIDDLVQAKYPSLAPGCAVLVAKGGQVIYKKAFGAANLELNTPMKPEMVFRIGSITKQYTAIAILQLMEQGKLSLQDSLQQFIKDFPYKGHTITIEHLLTHTSGIIGYDALDAKIPFILRMDLPPAQIIDTLKKQPLQFTPGSRYNYSNSNYYLLGYIIEIISGKTYKEYLQQNIFTPLELSNTYYDDPNLIIPNRVSGYINDNGNYRNAGYLSMSLVYAAGALASNVEDLFKWHQALYAYKLVKKETVEKAFTPYKLTGGQLSEYGYGWFIKNIKGNKYIAHGGAIDGFRAMELYIPAHDIFIATLINSENDASTDLAIEISDLILGKTAV
ncbi:MAG TPA: serine hydrolase domain-containing protein, partial [Flavobacterium sp.]|nr:serine hydrolase domain-containing protein [Flavobacterium sp.]